MKVAIALMTALLFLLAAGCSATSNDKKTAPARFRVQDDYDARPQRGEIFDGPANMDSGNAIDDCHMTTTTAMILGLAPLVLAAIALWIAFWPPSFDDAAEVLVAELEAATRSSASSSGCPFREEPMQDD